MSPVARILLLLLPLAAAAQQANHYPADYAQIVAGAKKEGRVVVQSDLGKRSARPLIDDFRALYPGIEVVFVERSVAPDVMWSSAMDSQLKLVEEGRATTYRSPEIGALPSWAVYRDVAYGTTYEPVVFVYNKKRLREEEVPRAHDQLARMLIASPARYRGKVATLDIRKNGLGAMFIVQDRRHHRGLEDLASAMGKVEYRLVKDSATLLDKVASGDYLLGYNVPGSEALARARRTPALGVVMPQDYTLVLSRVAFIAKEAKHPNAAKLWLDYLLSARGQKVISDALGLFAIREDVEVKQGAARLGRELGARARPITIDGDLALTLEPSRREALIKRWTETVAAARR
jgi:iron(III) transport system substrate-binding protein